MKFIKDIIAEKREEVGHPEGATLATPEQIARVLAEKAESDQPLQLGDALRVETAAEPEQNMSEEVATSEAAFGSRRQPAVTETPDEHAQDVVAAFLARQAERATQRVPAQEVQEVQRDPSTDGVPKEPVRRVFTRRKSLSQNMEGQSDLVSEAESRSASGEGETEPPLRMDATFDPPVAPEQVDPPVSLDQAEREPAPPRSRRVKTRLLGFAAEADIAGPLDQEPGEAAAHLVHFPVGWLAVVEGPGRGATFTLSSGVSSIGRGEGQAVRLDFGDNSISRDNHAAVAYDAEQRTFFVGHGGKANLVRRNGRPVLCTEALEAGDQLRIGETTLKFVPLCSEGFDWQDTADQPLGDERPFA
ncbi:FHA domain-containing protein [Epibacterium ulvae]|uniref:FHA domain-containing protein n=1 Tax=Epibacterium ulvae TaxID=1156985 RepID=UPI002490080B|nr:FHA domain-containing protein [Epibacterium ulvae]